MKGYSVYSKIHQLKERGFRKDTVAKSLGINWRTVDRYWNMTVDEYESNVATVCKVRLLDDYQDTIISWLRDYPTLSAAQVCDWLKEHYSATFSERTVSRYVKNLRNEYDLRKALNQRDYAAVPELPMGQQLQVDFGEKWLKNVDGGRIKVYAAAFVLAHSRFKYAELQSRPYTASDLVRVCHQCFRYMGGMPQEMVFDQDSIVCVAENAGDIIHTYEFEKLRQECKLSIYMCRGADPESKGKVESTVKYVKGNFLENRLYVDDDILNSSCLDWLERTANAKIHGTTKRVPAEVFAEEREYLRPLVDCAENNGAHLCRTVRKDNTVIYDSNRYSVPLGTYNAQKEVCIVPKDGILYIQTVFGDRICQHRISNGRGLLIQSRSHQRDRTSSLNQMQVALGTLLLAKADDFLQTIRTEKSRYARDQFKLIHTLCDQYAVDAVLEAVGFCQYSNLYSANYIKDYLEHNAFKQPQPPELPLPMSNAKYHVTTQKRSLDVYAKESGDR
ncbi:IS21 family transposase [Sporomusa aerivorans]|uniref:IS21 family transposase n=1 Tax=Sporomusa aerivorans TaxID=204936 RepID=UPI00352AAB56